jgi:hypothetical protein
MAFLSAVNDEAKYGRLVGSVEELEPVPGVEIGVFAARGEASLARAYERLRMEASAWRYKVYVHQDVVILNRSLVAELVRLFERPTVGLVGVAGCRFLPPSYVWWDGSGLYGRVIEDRGDGPRPLDFDQPSGTYQAVECIDGVLMAAQYDVSWDAELPGFHFYDVAQSTRYLLAGYDVVVPRQDEPWVRHDIGPRADGPSPEYRSARDTFASRYGERRDRFVRSRVRRRARRLAARLRLAAGSG